MTASTWWTWATITGTDPLRVRLDGDSTALPFTPACLVDADELLLADRVRCEITGGHVIVHGRPGGVGGGGPAPTPSIDTSTATVPAGANGSTTMPNAARFNGMCQLALTCTFTAARAADATTAATVGVLPVGFRPASTVPMQITTGGTGYIQSNGNVVANWTREAIAAGGSKTFHVSAYILAQT